MTTSKQITANRRNALRSTGPRTLEGKNASALNSMKHGLLAEKVLLPDEDRLEFEGFLGDLRTRLNPEGPLESALVDRIGFNLWRLRRAAHAEAGIFRTGFFRELESRAQRQAEEFTEQVCVADQEAGVEERVANQERHAEALSRMDRARAEREDSRNILGLLFARYAEESPLEKLSRYEIFLERGLYRAIRELQFLQVTRGREGIPSPVAFDISVDRST
jgi:hypothetical protein